LLIVFKLCLKPRPVTVPGFFLKLRKMYNQAKITECFRDLIGFEQSSSTDYLTLSDDIVISNSGLTVQLLHPLLNIENLYNCAQLLEKDFSKYLYDKRDAAIIKLINNIYTAKQLNENSRELLTEVKMYEGAGNFSELIVKNSRFVGFRLENIQKDLALLVRSIGLQFDTLNPDFKLYVYHSSKSDPVAIIEIKHNKAVSFTWFALSEINKQILSASEGSAYLVGYYEDDLQGQAIKREQYFMRKPGCSSCEHLNLALYKKWSQYFSIRPFYVGYEDLKSDKTKWEEDAELYVDGTNWGLNLAISVICDVSDLFCRNREIFIDALGKQIAVEFLNDILFSTRDNQNKQKIFQAVLYALGDNNNPGAKVELEKAIKAVNFTTSDLNTICLPCQDDAYRINYRSVY
jgi:hypothetical protein